jgi:hypothetical protein
MIFEVHGQTLVGQWMSYKLQVESCTGSHGNLQSNAICLTRARFKLPNPVDVAAYNRILTSEQQDL